MNDPMTHRDAKIPETRQSACLCVLPVSAVMSV